MKICDKVIIKSHMRIEYAEIVTGDWNKVICDRKEFGVNVYYFKKIISEEDVIKYVL